MTTSFFKIILSTQPRLRLPHKFVRKYKESMPSVVSVDFPSGPAFQVELTQSDGEIWLDKGFKQFMDYYSIKPGYLIVFNCHFETSFFHVTIFDQSGTEIDYPLTIFNGKHPEKVSEKPCCPREETEVVSGKCIDCLYNMLCEVSRKRKISRGKKLEASPKNEVSDRLEKDEYYGVSDSLMNDISRKRKNEKLQKIKRWKKGKQTVKPKELTAHERAKAFICTRPSFVRFMHRSYVNDRLMVSKLFAQKLINKKKSCNVVLRVPGCTRIWTAKCSITRYNARLRWRTFVQDNGLCEGDACVFELGNDITPSLKVIIFRSSEEVKGNLRNTDVGEISRKRKVSEGMKLDEADDDDVTIESLEKIPTLADISRKPKTCKRKKLEEVGDISIENLELNAHERAKAFISTRPSFVSFMHLSYIDCSLSISKRFAKECFKINRVCDVVLRVPGITRTWTSKCKLGRTNAKLLWRRFVKDNGLCEGDACVFELGNDITPSLNVIIFRSTEEAQFKGNMADSRMKGSNTPIVDLISNVKINICFWSHNLKISVPSNFTFGDLKQTIAHELVIEPQVQKLLFRGIERDDNDHLSMAGVKDNSDILLVVEKPSVKEFNEEVKASNEVSIGGYAVAEVREEVDKLSEELSGLEAVIQSGAKVDKNKINDLTEMFMEQLLKLDGIEAQGEGRLQRRIEARRVQSFVDTLDLLKAKSSNPIGNDNNAAPVTTP